METSGSLHALCDDALLEILVRLPSKSVLRCRAVCKNWRRITTDLSFLAAHAARRPRQMLVITQSYTVSAIPLSLDPSPADDDTGRRRGCLCDPTTRDEDGTRISLCGLLSSLDGLLVLQQSPGRFIVCNPTTRQWTKLPALGPEPCTIVFACGFYFHSPSGEYRLLCHGTEAAASSPDRNEEDSYYYILSAGAAMPRRLARAPADRPVGMGYEHPVACREILHWCSVHPEARRTGKMLAFHTVTETFWLMARPPCNTSAPQPPYDTAAALLELDGALCAVAMQGMTLLNIWALQDYESQRWMLRDQVVMQPPESLNDRFVDKAMAISEGGDAILIGRPPYSRLVKLLDLKEKKLRKKMDLSPSYPKFIVFSESLMPHAFFESPRCFELGPLKFSD